MYCHHVQNMDHNILSSFNEIREIALKCMSTFLGTGICKHVNSEIEQIEAQQSYNFSMYLKSQWAISRQSYSKLLACLSERLVLSIMFSVLYFFNFFLC